MLYRWEYSRSLSQSLFQHSLHHYGAQWYCGPVGQQHQPGNTVRPPTHVYAKMPPVQDSRTTWDLQIVYGYKNPLIWELVPIRMACHRSRGCSWLWKSKFSDMNSATAPDIVNAYWRTTRIEYIYVNFVVWLAVCWSESHRSQMLRIIEQSCVH